MCNADRWPTAPHSGRCFESSPGGTRPRMVEVTRVPSGIGCSGLRLPAPHLPPGLVNAKVSNEQAAGGVACPSGPQVARASWLAALGRGPEHRRACSQVGVFGDGSGETVPRGRSRGRRCPQCRGRSCSFLRGPFLCWVDVPSGKPSWPAPSSSTSPLDGLCNRVATQVISFQGCLGMVLAILLVPQT